MFTIGRRTETMRIFKTLSALLFLIYAVDAKVCPGVDIRNEPSQLDKLRECRIVNGSLYIVLMDSYTYRDFAGYSFPKLIEVSDYMVVFRVKGLMSLRTLFPNLALIRGNRLLSEDEYRSALVIFDMPDIIEIGLYNLREIQNGNVQIGKCPNLCYVHTIDWKSLGTSLSKYADIPECERDDCAPDCQGHCWSPGKCQKHSDNCHPECLGCSKPNSTKDCEVCKNFKDGDTCVNKCPSEKFIDEETMSCLTATECESSSIGDRWTFQNFCIPRNTCIENYELTEKISPPSCVRCQGICNKTCDAISVSTKADIDALKGCTHIDGNLELRIEDIYVADQLESNLGDLREIDGCLKVARSPAISSLGFLKSLQRINGRRGKQCNNYTVFIYDNANLKTLIDVDHIQSSSDVSIGFHYNPELCISEIRKFATKLGISNETFDTMLKKSKDVSRYSNGDKDPCADLQLSVRIMENNPTNVSLQWEPYKAKNVTVMGYTIFYILASDLSEQRSHDVSSNMCDNSGWISLFVSNNTRSVLLTQLTPFSKYVYWIKVYHIEDDMSGIAGSTETKTFTTLPDDPSAPLSFEVVPISPTSFRLTWDYPEYSNGNLSHFQLIAFIEKDDPKFVSLRDYCIYPHMAIPVLRKEKQPLKKWLNQIDNGTCVCEPRILKLNDTFCGPLDYGFSFSNDDCNKYMYKIMEEPKNITKRYLLLGKSGAKIDSNATVVDMKLPANKTTFVLNNLKPFTTYIILFSACNQKFRDKHQCSAVLFTGERTKANVSADRISNLKLKILQDKDAILTWADPPNPNGMVVAYNIEYKSSDGSKAVNVPALDCITRMQHLKNSLIYRIRYIDPGVYSLRVRPISLYGPGLYSKSVKFQIKSPLKTWLIYLFVCIVFVIFVIVIIIYLWYKKKNSFDSIHLITSINPDYESGLYMEDSWEVSRDDVEINEVLGQGSFGQVCSGYIKSKNLPCAVKTTHNNVAMSYKTEFLNEASIMKQFSGGYHVVKLYGVVSRGEPPLVLMELMERGDLKEYLKRARDSSQSISSPELYQMAAQIADGMAYLTAKKFVHRDLAARNCMVAGDRTVKIGDFGMTKDVYMNDYYRKGTTGLLPVRWMAPESLADGIFTSESDIWSYGIILWEMVTLAEQPYQGMANDQVLNFVISRGRLGRPSECPDLLWEIMEVCWRHRPKERPLFLGIVELLKPLSGPSFALVSFYHSREGREYRLNSSITRGYSSTEISVSMFFQKTRGNHRKSFRNAKPFFMKTYLEIDNCTPENLKNRIGDFVERQREIIATNTNDSEAYHRNSYMVDEDQDRIMPQDEDFYPSNTRAFKRRSVDSDIPEQSSYSISNMTS